MEQGRHSTLPSTRSTDGITHDDDDDDDEPASYTATSASVGKRSESKSRGANRRPA